MEFELDLIERPTTIKPPLYDTIDYFVKGVEDKRADQGFYEDYENWNKIQQVYYEWGRQYVVLFPKFNVPIYRKQPIAIQIAIASQLVNKTLMQMHYSSGEVSCLPMPSK